MSPSSMPATRSRLSLASMRWPRAVVAVLIAALSAVPLAARAVGPETQEPTAFAVPPSWPGDRMAYRLDFDGGHLTYNLTWQPARWLLDPQDGWVQVRPLIHAWRMGAGSQFDGCGSNPPAQIDLLTLHEVGTTRVLWGPDGAMHGTATLCSGLPVLGGTREQTVQVVQSLAPGNSIGPCGLVNTLQWDASPPILLSGCDDAPATVVARGSHEGAGTLMVEVESESGPRRIHFRSDVPYPVRTSGTAGGWTLLGFERGEGPDAPLGPRPADVAMPEVRSAPPGRLGPEEAGARPEFPLAEAVEEARSSPRFSGLRDYMATHPDWVLVAAEAFETTTEGDPIPGWSLHFSDHVGGYQLMWSKGQGEASSVPLPPAVTDRLPTQNAGPGEATPPVLYSDAPMPTAGSVVARWRAFGTGAGESDRSALWSFSRACEAECGSWVQAGTVSTITSFSSSGESFPPTTPATPEPGTTQNLSALRFGAEGNVLAWFVGTRTDSSGPWTAPTAAPAYSEPAPAKGGPWLGAAVPLPSAPAAAGIGGAGLLAALAYFFWPALKGGLGLFSRVAEDELLAHPVRRRIATLVEAQPGIHYQALVRAAGVANGTLEHHMRKLLEAGLVTQRKGPGYTCYFPKGTGAALMSAAPALKSPGAQRILAAIEASPGSPSKAIAEQAGVDAATVTHHVERLRLAGLVTTRRDGRLMRLYAVRAGAPPQGATEDVPRVSTAPASN